MLDSNKNKKQQQQQLSEYFAHPVIKPHLITEKLLRYNPGISTKFDITCKKSEAFSSKSVYGSYL
jgi:hypothetical protein